jgi:acetyltransferase-like isoleucine patch superfamily enzyme
MSAIQQALPTLTRLRRRLRSHSPFEFFFGWLLTRRFTSAGACTVAPGFPKPRVINWGGEIHAEGCAFSPGMIFEVFQGGVIRIGKGTMCNQNVRIAAAREVSIGRNCLIGFDVVIADNDLHERPGLGPPQPVRIEDSVWIGFRAAILKGVTIGEGAVVGAGAIVTEDVPPHTLVVGQPAHPVRQLPETMAYPTYLGVVER